MLKVKHHLTSKIDETKGIINAFSHLKSCIISSLAITSISFNKYSDLSIVRSREDNG